MSAEKPLPLHPEDEVVETTALALPEGNWKVTQPTFKIEDLRKWTSFLKKVLEGLSKQAEMIGTKGIGMTIEGEFELPKGLDQNFALGKLFADVLTINEHMKKLGAVLMGMQDFFGIEPESEGE